VHKPKYSVNAHKKIIAKRRTALTEKQKTCFTKKLFLFWSAKPEQLFKCVPVLHYIPTLRFRDATAPGARNTVAAKNKKENASYWAKCYFISYTALCLINLIVAVILFAAQTKILR